MKPPACPGCASTLTAPLGQPGVPAPGPTSEWRCYTCTRVFRPRVNPAEYTAWLEAEVERLTKANARHAPCIPRLV